MKKFKIILLVALGFSLFSCEKAYDIKQAGEFSDEATFKSIADMNLYLNEVYDNATTQPELGFTAVFTDEVGVGYQNAGQNNDLYRFFLNQEEANSSAIWLNHYKLINYANRLLRGAALITPDPADVAEYNSILGQARALRAFAHFQLLTYFSTDLKNNNALGVILMDRVPNLGEELPRSTNGAVFGLIDADLQYAEANVIDHPAAVAYKFISKNFINAFKARMYLYRGDYTNALLYANTVITTSGLSLTAATPVPAGVPGSTAWNTAYYGTSSTNPYRRMWADAAQGEVIFGLDRPAGKGSVAGLFYFNRTQYSGGPYHEMGRTLFNMLDQDFTSPTAQGKLGDVRRYAFIDPTSRVDSGTGTYSIAPDYTTDTNYKANDVLLIDKYPGKGGTAELNNDLKVFRLSEMYFIKAEAQVNAGDLPGAAASIKAVRDARNFIGAQPLPVYANATAAWADILKERRLELCYEGHRYIDLKRLGVLAGVTIDRNARDCDGIAICTLPTTDYRFTMPISIDEIIGNSNIQQNPNY